MKKPLIHLMCLALIVAPGLSIASAMQNNANQPTLMHSTEQIVSDSEITSKIKSNLLLNKDISSFSISVSTLKGRVTLKGNVGNALQMQEALKIAKQVSGVKSVKNDLLISHSLK